MSSAANSRLSGPWHYVFLVFSALAILLAVNQLFNIGLFGFLPLNVSYLYYLLALYLSLGFLMYPAVPSDKTIRWYDVVLFFTSLVVNLYFGVNGMRIIGEGWDWSAPALANVFSVIMWLLVLEAIRRSGGRALFIICLIFSLYPLIAHVMPGFLKGQSYNFLGAARAHVLSINSILGVPLQTVGTLLIGFILFGVVLQTTGGGQFFLNLALATMGGARGGPAKVAVASSALFGSMSGSVISNVITTGSMTIPAMRRSGFPGHFAGAVEACSSTGGAFMPPIMGAAAFVMASFLNVPYLQVAIAAAIPALLYYWALFVSVDAYASRIGLQAMSREERPSLRATLAHGWHFILAFVLVFYLLFELRVEAWAPFYGSLALVVLSFRHKETRMNWRRFLELLEQSGRALVELVVLLAGVGLIVGGLSVTGVALAFSRELVAAVGDNVLLILLAGAITSFILGMGMTATSCYIFLAIVMAPALVRLGVDPMGAHLFVLYWGLLSYLTPPVAFASFTAAGIAGADPMRTGFTAMKLAAVLYVLPFFFALNPALLTHAPAGEVIYVAITAAIGVWLVASSFQGYLAWIGRMDSMFMRLMAGVGGILIVTPEQTTDVIGAVLSLVAIIGVVLSRRRQLTATTELAD